MRRFKMISGLLAVALAAVAMAASASPAGAKEPQEYYKKIQHQWVLGQKALANGNMKAVKMHRRKALALTEQYRQSVRLNEQAAGPEVSPLITTGISLDSAVVLLDPSLFD